MCSVNSLSFPANLNKGLDCFLPFDKPIIFQPSHLRISSNMWRNVAKQAISKSPGLFYSSSRAYSFLGISHDSIFREILPHQESLGKPSSVSLRNQIGLCNFLSKGYASVAEAISSTDIEEDSSLDEIQELLQEMRKQDKRQQVGFDWRNHLNLTRAMSQSRYLELRRRQVKIETEAWEEAAKEYSELLMDMCEQKLAPNLPYMKSLFLGWFEPLREAIVKEQELCRNGKNKTAYAPYFIQLPADKMAVITMHKLVGLLMTGSEHGTARVIQAVCSIGDAIEQE